MTHLRNAGLALSAVLFCAAMPDRLQASESEPPRSKVIMGACCFGDASCELREAADCANSGGLYQGDGTACTEGLCDSLLVACCFWSTGACDIRTLGECAAAGGSHFGYDCDGCMRLDGACCLTDGACFSQMTLEDCEAAGGVFQGWGSFCEGPCWGGGACCFTDYCYENVFQADCASMGGAFYLDQSCWDVYPGCSEFTGVGQPDGRSGFSLAANPNPSSEITSLELELPREQEVLLSVYDVSGRRVRLLAHGHFASGRQTVVWDQRDDSRRDLPAGIYFVRLTSTSGLEVTERITVVR
jgi:FlgD Ig-like domain